MGIKTKCKGCNKTVNAPDSFAGKTSSCPKCGGTLRFAAGKPADDLFDDLIPEAPKASAMPPEPPAEMQPVSYTERLQNSNTFDDEQAPTSKQKPIEIAYPPNGMPVVIKRINIPLWNAIVLIITFWVASLTIAFVLVVLWFMLFASLVGASNALT